MLIKHNKKSTSTRIGVNAVMTAAIALGLGMSAVPANAYIPRGDEVKISFNIDDLSQPNGVERVYEMMTKEAARACKTDGHRSLEVKRLTEMCTADLINDFVVDLNDTRLSRYHATQLDG